MDHMRETVKAWGNRHPKLRVWGSFAVFYLAFQPVYRWVIAPLEPASHHFLSGLIWGLGLVLVWCAITLPIQWGPRTPEFKAVRWMAPGCLVIGVGLVALACRL